MNERAERPKPERRGSSLSPEEVQQAIEVRKKALKSPDVDLGTIARTAPAISSSPTQPTSIVTDADVRVSLTFVPAPRSVADFVFADQHAPGRCSQAVNYRIEQDLS